MTTHTAHMTARTAPHNGTSTPLPADRQAALLKTCAIGLLIAAAASFSGCTSHGTVAAAKIEDSVTIAPALKDLLARNPHPSIVLRIPSSAPSATQAEAISTGSRYTARSSASQSTSGAAYAQGGAYPNAIYSQGTQSSASMQAEWVNTGFYYNDSIYNAIEQEFVKHGFVVRDRQLLNTVLEKTDTSTNYAELGRRLQADIMIEITTIDIKNFWQSEYTDEKGVSRTVTTSTRSNPAANTFDTPYRVLSGKLIITGEGAIGGFFTYNFGGEGGAVVVKKNTNSGSPVRFNENPWKKIAMEHPEDFPFKAIDTKDTWKPMLWFPPPDNRDSAVYFAQKLIGLFTNPNAAGASGK